MIVIPAIDIEGGRVTHGGPAADPVTEARTLRAAGARWIHVVDMDRFFGRGDNLPIVRRLVDLEGPVQLGGGLTDPDDVTQALGWGVDRVVLGTEVVLDAARLEAVCRAAGPDRLAAGVDLRDGQVWPRGATGPVPDAPSTCVERAVAEGIRTVVCRDLDRDGQLAGAALSAAGRLTGHGADIIVAGGLAALDELDAARAAGLAGAIIGRALQAGRFSIREALAWSA